MTKRIRSRARQGPGTGRRSRWPSRRIDRSRCGWQAGRLRLAAIVVALGNHFAALEFEECREAACIWPPFGMVSKGTAGMPVQSISRATLSPPATPFLISYFSLASPFCRARPQQKFRLSRGDRRSERVCWKDFCCEKLGELVAGRSRFERLEVRRGQRNVSQASVHVGFSCGVYHPERRKVLANAPKDESWASIRARSKQTMGVWK
jgi:hypothetical protein